MKISLLAAAFITSIWSTASPGAGVPEVKFQLGDGNRDQALLWVSGFSYALDAMGRINRARGAGLFCTPEDGYIGSKDLFEILNEKHEGMSISTEQATQTIMVFIPRKFKCS